MEQIRKTFDMIVAFTQDVIYFLHNMTLIDMLLVTALTACIAGCVLFIMLIIALCTRHWLWFMILLTTSIVGGRLLVLWVLENKNDYGVLLVDGIFLIFSTAGTIIGTAALWLFASLVYDLTASFEKEEKK